MLPRGRLFLAAVAISALVGGGVVLAGVAGSVNAGPRRSPDAPATIAALRATPHVFFRHSGIGDRFGRVAVAGAADAADSQALTGLDCARFHFAGGRGICLTEEPGIFAAYRALLLDADLNVMASHQLSGIPSRARVSPDGRFAAATVFVSGHSYAGGSFSTQTLILDAATGVVAADLEQFSVVRDGAPWRDMDFNFWGVTFSTHDSDLFYATLGSGGQAYLVRGRISEQRFEVLAHNVECPSLSPDGSRIAFKRRVDNAHSDAPLTWRIHVLDLADMTIAPLGNEERNIDDQLEWLDTDHVLYAYEDPLTLTSDIWVTHVATGQPRVFLAAAESPAVVSSPD